MTNIAKEKLENQTPTYVSLAGRQSPNKKGIQNKLFPMNMQQLTFCFKEKKRMPKLFWSARSN
jgi:lipid II:glycine glycyltransferase (peptidoglycan interpeptide bridge formation enzyme)